MKFIEKETDDGKSRYLFTFGRAEAFILQKLLEKAIRFMPNTMLTQSTERRMSNMSRCLKAAIGSMESETKDDYAFLNHE